MYLIEGFETFPIHAHFYTGHHRRKFRLRKTADYNHKGHTRKGSAVDVLSGQRTMYMYVGML
jgi:hypothetical protein